MRPIMDCNVHLWDQRDDPVGWLADRTAVRDLLGDYDSLPEVYPLADYRAETAAYPVRGVVWSDAGSADPLHAAAWVQRQADGQAPGAAEPPATGARRDTAGPGLDVLLVTLADPASAGWPGFLRSFAELPAAAGVRVRLVSGLGGGTALAGDAVAHLRLMAEHGLTLTVEATADQLGEVARLARELPEVRVVLDHFGWPTDLTAAGSRAHAARLAEVAAAPNTATRVDALGTIFGDWTADRVRPWLHGALDAFGPSRCMLGSDLPIERLRGGFTHLYDAYEQVFAGCTEPEREDLWHGTARRWYGG
ncbi:amidohydrolase family protein [Catellatospora methionotrophica]|uniref:amidohydrolase family protein n=1 Tax=Catellatospora methionotrophica TaxID=121620 RepID=UPI0033D5B0C1